MGLQRLFEDRYGPTPQIDLDLQIARARVPSPCQLDFQDLADGVVRNNVGVDGILLAVRATTDGDTVVIDGTGQRLPLAGTGAAGAESGPWLWFDVRGFEPDGTVSLVPVGASSGPDQRPAGAPVGEWTGAGG